MVDKRVFRYRIDADDRLVYVNEDWLAFARENKGTELTSEKVLERPLWDFIQDMETKHLYRSLFMKLRERSKPVTIPFRCDSPECRRHMEMYLAPGEDGSIGFDCRLLKTECLSYIGLLDPEASRGEEFVTICSWCKRLKVSEGQWADIEKGIAVMDLFSSKRLPQLTHGMCPFCKEIAGKKIKGLG